MVPKSTRVIEPLRLLQEKVAALSAPGGSVLLQMWGPLPLPASRDMMTSRSNRCP